MIDISIQTRIPMAWCQKCEEHVTPKAGKCPNPGCDENVY